MMENLKKFRNIFLFNEITKTKIYIITDGKLCNKVKNIIIDLHNILPHSKMIKNISKKDFLGIIFTKKLSEDLIFFHFSSVNSRKCELLLFSSIYDVIYRFLINNFKYSINSTFLGNCLKWSKPLIIFDDHFKKKPHLIILKNILIKICLSKTRNLRSEPIIDHVISFIYIKSKIYMRVHQIKGLEYMYMDDFKNRIFLIEIGPRVSLFLEKCWTHIIEKKEKIFDFL